MFTSSLQYKSGWGFQIDNELGCWALDEKVLELQIKRIDTFLKTANSKMVALEKERNRFKSVSVQIFSLLEEMRELSVTYTEAVTLVMAHEARLVQLEETHEYLDLVRSKVFPLNEKTGGIDYKTNKNLEAMDKIRKRLETVVAEIDNLQTGVNEDATNFNGWD